MQSQSDVYIEVLEAAHPLHGGPTDHTIYLFKGGVSLERRRGEPLQKHAWRGWNKHKHRSASVHRRRVQCKLSKH